MKKRYLAFLLCAFAAVFAVCFTACNTNSPEPVAIYVTQPDEGEKLIDYMNDEQSNGKLTFEVASGMVTKINGVANTTNSYWMLYTDDANNSNSTWGTYEYDGKTLASAALGAEALVVVDGCLYVWVYTTF